MIEEALTELETYLDEAGGKIDPGLEQRAREVLAFGSRRIRAGQQTVVAIAGATGSGKSSLFNAVSGTDIATVGARRPTTSKPLVLSFSATNGPLMNLLQVTRRHEAVPPTRAMRDVVLLDLPDHDSLFLSHREHVDRLVRVVDQFVFVVDPQKYADEALHARYLRPLAEHGEVISVVLNHADALTGGGPVLSPEGLAPEEGLRQVQDGGMPYAEGVARVVEHLRHLLVDDGLGEVPIFATDAADGQGVDVLRHHLGRIATNKRAMYDRLAADLRGVAYDLSDLGARATSIQEGDVEELASEVAMAAGVPRVAKEVRLGVLRRGALFGAGRGADEPLVLTGRRVASVADDARATSAVRRFVRSATTNLPALWREEVSREVLEGEGQRLPAHVDTALRDVDLSELEYPAAWGTLRILKWLPIVALAALVGWIVVELVWTDGSFLPRLLTIVGAAAIAGGLMAWLSGRLLRRSARKAERRARKKLDAAVRETVDERIVAELQRHLDAHTRAQSALGRLTGILARG